MKTKQGIHIITPPFNLQSAQKKCGLMFEGRKKFAEQIRIVQEVLHSRDYNPELKKLVKGVMIESYIVEGNQKIDEHIYGKSITDPCLGWEKTKQLILDIANERRKMKSKINH